MTVADERIIAVCREMLEKDLNIEVEEGGFTDPNGRTIKLILHGKQIASCSINIKSRREYEG
jgi:hypothetical protein